MRSQTGGHIGGPQADDLIVPLPPDTIERRTKRTGESFRGYDYSGRRWREVDLSTLGWRQRSLYDTRATCTTLACDEDGADRDVIRTRVTHAAARCDAFDARGRRWAETCTEVAKLKLSRRAGATPHRSNRTKPRSSTSTTNAIG